tara:strand:- start:477 stop:6611 length:6135 start_codon:yes stop_codon:yes gene_type:complete
MSDKKLTPKMLDKLNANSKLMQEQGYSQEDIKSMGKKFFNQFSVDELGKTGAVVGQDATTAADMDLASANGSLEPQEESRDRNWYHSYKKATKDSPTDYNVENPVAQFLIDKVAAFTSGATGLLAGAADAVESIPDALISSGINAYNYFGDDENDVTQESKNEISNFIEDIWTLDDSLRIVSEEAAKFKTVRDSEDGEGIVGAFSEGNYLEGIDRTISGVFEAAPSVIAAFTPGGMYVIGASAVGSHYEEKSEFSNKDRGAGMLLVSMAQGGVELASEMVTRGIFRGAAKTFQIAGKSAKESIKETGKLLAKDMFFEGASEVGSEEINNVADQMYGLNKFYDKNGDFDGTALLQRSFDTFLVSSLLGGGTSVGGTLSKKKKEKLSKIQQAFKEDRMMSPEMRGQNLEVQKEITRLEKENEGVENEQVINSIAGLKAKLQSNLSSNKAVVENMDKDSQVEYFDLLKKNGDLKAEASNLSLNDSQKQTNITLLEKNNNRLNEIYNNTVVSNNEAVIEDIESVEEDVSTETENLFTKDDATVYTNPTDDKYATINRSDEKGNVNLTKEEFDALDEVPAEQTKPQTVKELELERNEKADKINLAIKESEGTSNTPMVDGKPVKREDLDLLNQEYASKIEEASKLEEVVQEEALEETVEDVVEEVSEATEEPTSTSEEERTRSLKPTKKEKDLFKKNKLSESERRKIIVYALDKKIKNKKLTPFEKEVIDSSDIETVSDIRILLEDIDRADRTRDYSVDYIKKLTNFVNSEQEQTTLGEAAPAEEISEATSEVDNIDYIDETLYNKNVNQTPEGTEFINVYRAEGKVVDRENLPLSVRGNAGSWFTPFKAEVERYTAMGNRKVYKIAIPKALYDNLLEGRKGDVAMSKGEIQLPRNISSLKTEVSKPTQQTSEVEAKKTKNKTKTQKEIDKKVDKKIDSSEKVTMTSKSALYKQMKDFSRGGKKTKDDIKKFRIDLQSKLKSLAGDKKGLVKMPQVNAIIKKLNSVNPNDLNQISDLVDYAEKVFNDANYADKISKAQKIRKQVKSGAKDKKQEATLVELAKRFAKIDPKNVEDIDAYIEMANKIKNGVVTSKIIKTDVNWTSSPDIVNADVYISTQMEVQNKKELDKKIEEFERVTGIPSGDLTYSEMIAVLTSEKEVDTTKETLIRKGIDKTFETYKSIINSIISEGVDPFTGENLALKNKDLIKEFMNLDLNGLEIKEAIRAVDSLNNFLINGSTGGMQTVVSNQKGVKGMLGLVKGAKKARDLKLFFSNRIGRSLGQGLTNLPILFETMFPGQEKAAEVMGAMGVTELTKGVSSARRDTTTITKNYLSKFEKTKPNNKTFNDTYNITERGMIGFMTRNIIGDKTARQAKFDDNKSLIEQAINNLSKGSKEQQKKAETYKEVYESILKDSKSIEDVNSKSDKINLEGLKFWQKEWKALYPQLAEVSLNVYNKVLSEDVDYVPRSIKNVDISDKSEFNWDESSFVGNEGTVYQRKSGTLQEVVVEKNISFKGKEKYVDLNFDSNNAFLYQSALTDVNTANSIRQVKGAIESNSWSKLIPNKADRNMLENRLKGYISNARGKDASMDDFSKELNKASNFVGNLSTTLALASVFQPIKQTVPVIINTLINTGGMLDVKDALSNSANNFIDKSGYAVSNRGKESQTTLDADKVLESIDNSTSGKAIISRMKKANSKLLDLALVKPDVWIARASWLAYYRKSLKNQGIDTSNMNWDTEKLNEEAGNYAQQQLDRQQNVSDADLQGDVLTSKNPAIQVAKKIVMPFMNFVLNQKARMYSDIITLSSDTASSQDKKAARRSLAGLSAEIAVFTAISSGVRDLIWSATKLALDFEEEEEEIKDRKEFEKRLMFTSVVRDIFSPLPMLDSPVLYTVDQLLDSGQEEIINTEIYGEQFKTFNKDKKSYIESLGLYGIVIGNWQEWGKIYEMAVYGTITKEAYGKEKTTSIPKKTQEVMSVLLFVSAVSNFGLLPTDLNNISKKAIRIAEMQPDHRESQDEIATGNLIRERELEKNMEDESTKRIMEIRKKGYPDKK